MIAVVVLFLAMAAYLGVHFWQGFGDSVLTAPVIAATVTQSAPASGILVRDEQILTDSHMYRIVLAKDGERLPAGGTVAIAADSAEALSLETERLALTTEIARLESRLGSVSSDSGPAERDTAIKAAVLELSAAVSSGDGAARETATAWLESLVLSGSDTTETVARLSGLRGRLFELGGSRAESIAAPVSGLFSSRLDGFEDVSPGALEDLSVSGLDKLMETQTRETVGAIGKLCVSYRWYFAAAMDAEQAALLTAGSSANLLFGRLGTEPVVARVESVSTAQSGRCVIIFSATTSLAETASERLCDAEVIWGTIKGLQLPSAAIQLDEEGSSFVWAVSSGLARQRFIEVIMDEGDYVLVSPLEGEELSVGSLVVVGAEDVYDGMSVVN